jgi:hypothetical protein
VLDGQAVKKTIDFPSSLGSIFLVHEDKEVIKKDYKTIVNTVETLIN